MSISKPKYTKIYIGDSIEHGSERSVLAAIVSVLERECISAILLVNVEINGRQIDCVVCTERSASVIEAKVSYLPVRGGINGSWERLSVSGIWTNYPNAYRQALSAKNALRDAMGAVRSSGSYYPDGYVVFASGLPAGSEVTPGDYKVTVGLLDAFLDRVGTATGSPWGLKDWEVFAQRHRLTAVTLPEVTADAKTLAAMGCFERYRAAVVTEYGRDGNVWLCERPEQQSELLTAAATGSGCFIGGPSGCGKTLMAKWLAAQFATKGAAVVFLAAKDFAGSWADAIRREIALLVDDDPLVVRRAIALAGAPIVIIVDGINELGAQVSVALRGANAVAQRFGARLVLTGQDARPKRFDGLNAVLAAPPSLGLKQRIATGTGVALTQPMLDVLPAVTSGIEALIVGRIGNELRSNAARVQLLDQYVRLRLGLHARIGSLALRKLALLFHDRVAYSMPEPEFDAFMHAQSVDFGACDALFAAGILVGRAGRVSFAHEMFQNACAAFDLACQAVADVNTFGPRLSTPLLEPLAADVLSAVEDSAACRALLAHVTNASVLVAAADGHLGSIVAENAKELLSEANAACLAEIQAARLHLDESAETVSIAWEEWCRRDWTTAEQAQLAAIGLRAKSGSNIRAYFDLCAAMDHRLTAERERWTEVARARKFPMRSQSFSLAYLGFGQAIGFTEAPRALQSGFDCNSPRLIDFDYRVETMSSGQLYFYLDARIFDRIDNCNFLEELIFLFRERFRFEPYHVQLAMLFSVPWIRQEEPAALAPLIDAITTLHVNAGNWGINSSIIEALKSLGALDDEAESARTAIKEQILSVLVDDENNVDYGLARSLCVSMFDHPFDSIYAEEIHALPDERQHRLYRRALKAEDVQRSMSADWLTQKIASLDDPADVPVLRLFTRLPDHANPFAQDEWRSFALAVRFVGRHQGELADIEPETPSEHCLAALRSLVYLTEAAKGNSKRPTADVWQKLSQMPVELIIGCMSEMNEALRDLIDVHSNKTYPPIDIPSLFPDECLCIARRFIDKDARPLFHHRVPHTERALSFAFDIIVRFGDRSDVDRLRQRSRAHPFASYALGTLRGLERRL